jgi:DNA-binding MarR family transcriptional regulator
MAKTSRTRADLLKQLLDALRKVSAQSVLLSDTVAKIVGLNSTDLECLDLIEMAGPTTAGRLAEHAGLTTGAMTAVIDRLERAGRHVAGLYRRLAESTARLHDEYDDHQLALVVEYLTRAHALAADHVAWLQAQRSPVQRKRRTRRPRRVAPPPPPTAQTLRS